jgi:hypothetical protein
MPSMFLFFMLQNHLELVESELPLETSLAVNEASRS